MASTTHSRSNLLLSTASNVKASGHGCADGTVNINSYIRTGKSNLQTMRQRHRYKKNDTTRSGSGLVDIKTTSSTC